MALVEEGAGNPNVKYLDEIKSRRRKSRKNNTFLRMYLPVIVAEINSAKGRGLIARRPIKKGELVATYSGNVVSLAQATKFSETDIKNYLFHLISGPDVQTNFVVCPKTFGSAGIFMNHANSKCKINVKAFITIHRNRPIILMQGTKNIDYGK